MNINNFIDSVIHRYYILQFIFIINVFVRRKSDSGVMWKGVTYLIFYEWAPDRLIDIQWNKLLTE